MDRLNLTEELPEYFRGIYDFTELLKAEQEEADAAAQAASSVHNNFFVQRMDADAVAGLEALLGILSVPGEELAFRRSRLLGRLSYQPPYTMGFLYWKLNQLLGAGKWTCAFDAPRRTLMIESSADEQEYTHELDITVNRMKPCHIIYRRTASSVSRVRAASGFYTAGVVYNYRLSAWRLGEKPFRSIEEGTELMPLTTELAPLLSRAAAFTAEEVAAVRINGSVKITEFITKESSENRMEFSYAVNTSHTDVIRSVELLDGAGETLAVLTVHVPLASSLILKHTITFSGGDAA